MKSYMVAVQKKITIKPTIYCEVLAKNAKDAIKKAKKIKLKDEDFIEEIKTDSADVVTMPKPTRYTSAGLSEQYHSTKDCEICRSVELKVMLKKERKNLRNILRQREPNTHELEAQQKRITEIIHDLNDLDIKVKRSKYE